MASVRFESSLVSPLLSRFNWSVSTGPFYPRGARPEALMYSGNFVAAAPWAFVEAHSTSSSDVLVRHDALAGLTGFKSAKASLNGYRRHQSGQKS